MQIDLKAVKLGIVLHGKAEKFVQPGDFFFKAPAFLLRQTPALGGFEIVLFEFEFGLALEISAGQIEHLQQLAKAQIEISGITKI